MGRKRKHDTKWNRIPDFILVGSVIGGSIEGVIVEEDGHDKAGHRFVLVRWVGCDARCPDCHGQPTRHRWDKIKRGEVKSCGRLKRKLYAEHIKRRTEHPLIDTEGNPIPPAARLKKRKTLREG
jgi:hypothetical protein